MPLIKEYIIRIGLLVIYLGLLAYEIHITNPWGFLLVLIGWPWVMIRTLQRCGYVVPSVPEGDALGLVGMPTHKIKRKRKKAK